MAGPKVKPRLLRGYQDLLPPRARMRQRIIDAFRAAFEMYGFAPLGTPALEAEEILIAETGVDANKQTYRFSDLDNERVGLRYEFTSSLARAVAMNQNQLQFPFKRYQFGPVWRFDKPKRGRFREFMQMDIDIVGAQPFEPEVELISATAEGLKRLGIGGYYFRVNDRRWLSAELARLGVAPEKEKDVFRVLDKLQKQGEGKVRNELTGKMLLQDFDSALEYERMQQVAISDEAADGLLALLKQPDALREYLASFLARVRGEGVPDDCVVADPSLTRGLDYYTGFVCEIQLRGAEALGSIGGGGRYDNLVGRYTSTSLTGVGLSIGVDRLAESLAMIGEKDTSGGQSSARVFVAVFDDALVAKAAEIARMLREAGVATELWLKSGNAKGRTLSRQFKYADSVGIPLAVVAGEDELAKIPPVVQLKDLRTEFGEAGKQREVPLASLIGEVKRMLGV
jgi:histidyl-tRNA synthetase